MKVLITTFTYYPQRNGVASVSKYLAEGLAKNGYEVCVATCRDGLDTADSEVYNGVLIRRFDFYETFFKKPAGDISGYVEYVKNCGQDFLIMECLQCHTTDVLLPYLREMRCKKLIHAHGAPGLYMKPFIIGDSLKHTLGNTYNWLLRKWYYKRYFIKFASEIDASLSCCICATDIPYFNKTISRNYIIENSADGMFFKDNSETIDVFREYGIRSKCYILNIATFNERKNQSLLIDVFAKSNLKDCALLIIGTERNAYSDYLERKAKKVVAEKGCEIIILDKSVPRELFPSIIKQAELFVITSKWEEYPITLVETMAVGTPFLSTAVGNAHTLPGGITARNDEELPILLKTMFDNPRIMKRMSEMGKEYALMTNSPRSVISDLISIFNDVLRDSQN